MAVTSGILSIRGIGEEFLSLVENGRTTDNPVAGSIELFCGSVFPAVVILHNPSFIEDDRMEVDFMGSVHLFELTLPSLHVLDIGRSGCMLLRLAGRVIRLDDGVVRGQTRETRHYQLVFSGFKESVNSPDASLLQGVKSRCLDGIDLPGLGTVICNRIKSIASMQFNLPCAYLTLALTIEKG